MALLSPPCCLCALEVTIMASKDSTAHAIDPSYLSEGTQVSYMAVQSDALKDSSPIEVSDSPSKHEHCGFVI